jgi:hypothetical protein
MLTHCSFTFEGQKVWRTFLILHLTLPTSQKIAKSIKEWRTYEVFGAKGFNHR